MLSHNTNLLRAKSYTTVEWRKEETFQTFTIIGSKIRPLRTASNLEHRFVLRITLSKWLLGRPIPPRSKKLCTWNLLTCLKTSPKKSSTSVSRKRSRTNMNWCLKWEKPKKRNRWKKKESNVRRLRTRWKFMLHSTRCVKHIRKRKTKGTTERNKQPLPNLNTNTCQGVFSKNVPSQTLGSRCTSHHLAITTWAWRCPWAAPMDMIKWTSMSNQTTISSLTDNALWAT